MEEFGVKINRSGDSGRDVSEMTNDLLEDESRLRMFSLRPRFMDLEIYKAKKKIRRDMKEVERIFWGVKNLTF